jgi:hypothetical protein
MIENHWRGAVERTENDQIERIRYEARGVISSLVARSRRHRAQALALGIIIGYAAGVWTALGAR